MIALSHQPSQTAASPAIYWEQRPGDSGTIETTLDLDPVQPDSAVLDPPNEPGFSGGMSTSSDTTSLEFPFEPENWGYDDECRFESLVERFALGELSDIERIEFRHLEARRNVQRVPMGEKAILRIIQEQIAFDRLLAAYNEYIAFKPTSGPRLSPGPEAH